MALKGIEMNKKIILLVALSALNNLLYSNGIDSKYFLIDTAVLPANYDFSANKIDLDLILEEANNCYRYIYNYFYGYDPPTSPQIIIRIVPGGKYQNRLEDRVVYLDVDLLATGFSILPHEITHYIIYHSGLESYSEGLADYVQSMFGHESIYDWYYKGDIFSKINTLWKFNYNYERLKLVLDGFTSDGISVLEAQALVSFIINKFGISKTLEYIKVGGYSSFQEIFNVDPLILLDEFINTVNNYTSNVLWDDNIEEILDWLSL